MGDLQGPVQFAPRHSAVESSTCTVMASMPNLRAIKCQVARCLNALQNTGLKTAQPYNTYYGGANWAPGTDAQLGGTGAGRLPSLALFGTQISLRFTCPHMAIHGVVCLSMCYTCKEEQNKSTEYADLQMQFPWSSCGLGLRTSLTA